MYLNFYVYDGQEFDHFRKLTNHPFSEVGVLIESVQELANYLKNIARTAKFTTPVSESSHRIAITYSNDTFMADFQFNQVERELGDLLGDVLEISLEDAEEVIYKKFAHRGKFFAIIEKESGEIKSVHPTMSIADEQMSSYYRGVSDTHPMDRVHKDVYVPASMIGADLVGKTISEINQHFAALRNPLGAQWAL